MKLHIRLVILTVQLLAANPACQGADLTNQFPSNEVEFNNANPKMIWGETTNFLRGDYFGGKPLPTSLRSAIDVSNGVIVLSGNPPHVVFPAKLYIENVVGSLYMSPTKIDQGVPIFSVPATNLVHAFMPPVNERFILTMTNTNGIHVPKTSEGWNLGQPASLKPNTGWSDLPRAGTGIPGMFSIFPKGLFPMAFSDKIGAGISLPYQEVKKAFELDPAKYFALKTPGLYKLTVVQRIYVEDTNTCLKAIKLPPVAVDVRVEK